MHILVTCLDFGQVPCLTPHVCVVVTHLSLLSTYHRLFGVQGCKELQGHVIHLLMDMMNIKFEVGNMHLLNEEVGSE